MTGTVAWFSDIKGYGFITGADGHEYFIHYSQIFPSKGASQFSLYAPSGHTRTLNEGETVEFTVQVRKHGLTAYDVRPL